MIAIAPPPARRTLPRHISPSAAKSYLGCSLKFYFERVAGIPAPVSSALQLGKAVHAALQAFHLALWRGEDHSPEAVERAFNDAFTRIEAEDGPVAWSDKKPREKALEDGLRVVRAYLDSPEVLKEAPRAVEVLLTEEIEGLSVPLVGAMDLVRKDMTAVDFKTSATTPDEQSALFDHELQLVSYQLMIEQATGETPPALELLYLVKTKTPKILRFSMPPAGDARKQRAVAMLETAVDGIASQRFHPQPGMQCSWCSFRSECLKWQGGKNAQHYP